MSLVANDPASAATKTFRADGRWARREFLHCHAGLSAKYADDGDIVPSIHLCVILGPTSSLSGSTAAILIMRSAAVCKAPAAARQYSEPFGLVQACCGWSRTTQSALQAKMRTAGSTAARKVATTLSPPPALTGQRFRWRTKYACARTHCNRPCHMPVFSRIVPGHFMDNLSRFIKRLAPRSL